MDLAIGAVLRILTPKGYLPIAYETRMLSKSKQDYPIHNKELFAIVNALKKWRCYIEGAKDLTILTDNKLLEFFKTQSKLSRRQTGWMELIGNFDFKLTYRPGRELLQAMLFLASTSRSYNLMGYLTQIGQCITL